MLIYYGNRLRKGRYSEPGRPCLVTALIDKRLPVFQAHRPIACYRNTGGCRTWFGGGPCSGYHAGPSSLAIGAGMC